MPLQSLTLQSKVESKIAGNIITLKDIRTRKRFWLKSKLDPTRYSKAGTKFYVDVWGKKIVNPTEDQKKPYTNFDYIPLRFFPKWYFWQETYNFLPVPDYWERIIKMTIGVETRDNYLVRDEKLEGWWGSFYDYLAEELSDATTNSFWSEILTNSLIGDYPDINGKILSTHGENRILRVYDDKKKNFLKLRDLIKESEMQVTELESYFADWKRKAFPASLAAFPTWDGLEDEDYYVLASGENVMTVILQNRKQYDWIRPDCVVFFGRNTFSPDGLRWKRKKAIYELEYYYRRGGEKEEWARRGLSEKDRTVMLDNGFGIGEAEWAHFLADVFDEDTYLDLVGFTVVGVDDTAIDDIIKLLFAAKIENAKKIKEILANDFRIWQDRPLEYRKKNDEYLVENDVIGFDMPLMYWVKSWRYINVGNLFAEVVLEKCYVWQYYGNWMNTWFNARINKSLLNNDHISYIGTPIRQTNEPGLPVMSRNKIHRKHWPVDEDWYVVRPKEAKDETNYSIEAHERVFPQIALVQQLIETILGRLPNKVLVPDAIVNEGWIVKPNDVVEWGPLPANYILDESIAPAHHCPACDACYDFCGDLRDKKAMSSVIGGKNGGWEEKPIKASWQPGDGSYYQVIYTHFPKDAENLVNPKANISSTVILDENKKIITAIPSNVQLVFWDKDDFLLETATTVPSMIFLVDYYHEKFTSAGVKKRFPSLGLDAFNRMCRGAKITSDARRSPLNLRKFHWDYLPKCFADEPHLLVHSTVQFYFQYKLLFTANCKHLWVRRKGGGYALGYRITTRSSIAGILYCFESLDIFYKWEVKVRGSITNTSLINQGIATIQAKVFGKAKEILTGVADTLTDFIPGAKGVKKFFGIGGDTDQKAQLDSIAKSLEAISSGGAQGGAVDPDAYCKNTGIGLPSASTNQEKTEEEAQTERKSKATGKTKDKEVKPALFYTNTIDFSYDFWEFANRCVANPFMVRFEYSGVLYNNLVNNNNSSPIQNWQIRGSRFCQIVKKGDFQSDVRLGFDIKGRNLFQNICARGLTWYDEGTKWDDKGNIISDWWVPWIPQYKALQSYTLGATFNTSTQQGGEDTTFVPGQVTKTEGISFDPRHAALGYVTYFRVSHRGLFELIRKELSRANKGDNRCHHSDLDTFDNAYCLAKGIGKEGGAFCWGCSVICLKMIGNSIRVKVPEGGQWIKCILDLAKAESGPEDEVKNIPKDKPWTLVIELDGKFWVETEEPGKHTTSYKMDAVQAIDVQNFASRENKEPEWQDMNTATGSGIGSFEADKIPELKEFDSRDKEKQSDKPEAEARERGDNTEKDYQVELEKEQERAESERAEMEAEKEVEREQEREREREREREKMDEKEKLERQQQDREAKEKKEQRDKERSEQKKREKEVRETRQKKQEKRKKENKERERRGG